MKLYTKTTKDRYEFPLAVADSKAELAQMTGQTVNTVRSCFSKHYGNYHEIEIGPEMYPDNDGNLWYRNDKGQVVIVEG